MNDPVLIARLRDHLKENHAGRSHVDVSTIALELRENYAEYNRKNLNVFKQRISMAYGVLQQNMQKKKADDVNDKEGEDKKMVKPKRRRKDGEPDGNDIAPPAFSEVVKPAVYPSLRLSDLGGLDHIKTDLERTLQHLKNASLLMKLGAEPSRGILLHGPPGCGKTSLAIAIAGELEMPLMQTAGPELVAGISGQSEAHLRNLFKAASTRYKTTGCILFIDEIGTLSSLLNLIQMPFVIDVVEEENQFHVIWKGD